ncbi:MAG: pantetheine-phosphate adenylyltransferase [Thermodesulfobacteriota bacterium]|nr:pantetheine-phosphate adenylyltransferase [Thermodesulfobacteriota bacterium]
MGKVAVYPGSFDPITNGHLDIIERGMDIFDQLIVAVLRNPGKNPLFTLEERVEMLQEIFKNHSNVTVDSFDGLLVHYVDKVGAHVIIRGLRAFSDFENEFQMALMNRRMNEKIETLFMMPSCQWFYTSSRLIKEVASLNGNIDNLVPDIVIKKLHERFSRKN